MSTTPPGGGWVGLRPRRITPRRLGAAAVVYGVFVAGWYLGQPVTAECSPDQAALDRRAEHGGHVAVSTPPPVSGPIRKPSVRPMDGVPVDTLSIRTLSVTIHSVICANDTGERPRLQAWFEGDWK
ncbi:hypothetical protein AB0E99_32365 [Streptomyces sp. NPDC030592]|uniref:hypothetical protein n=1 Tax=Streptomyces sp. NPDC030592 TaxID=3155365 RepID=UPI00340F107E